MTTSFVPIIHTIIFSHVLDELVQKSNHKKMQKDLDASMTEKEQRKADTRTSEEKTEYRRLLKSKKLSYYFTSEKLFFVAISFQLRRM